MPSLRCFLLLLVLASPQAFAEQLYRVELILFRQAAPLDASQPAPHDWARGAQALSEADRQPLALLEVAARLNPDNGYEVLLHQAWRQNLHSASEPVALSAGVAHFGHFAQQGTLRLRPGRQLQADARFWVNRFGEHGQLLASERLQQSSRLQPGRLNYLDHQSLGLLIEVTPL